MKRKIYLEGEIGELFVKELEADVNHLKDIVSLLDANFDGKFKKYLQESEDRGIDFALEVAGKEMEENERVLPLKEGDFTLTAVPRGSKSKFVRVLLGVALMAVGYYGAIGDVLAFGAFSSAQVGFAMFTVGLNLTLTSLAMAEAPDPSVDKTGPKSYLFNGSEQNIVEGDPVPVLYGRLRVPGRPISFDVRANDNGVFTSGIGNYIGTDSGYGSYWGPGPGLGGMPAGPA